MATIKDIAKAAGVSASTVSNVLNSRGNVSYKKICLVQETAKKLGYRLNEAASALRSGQIRTVAVILPRVSSLAYADLYDGVAEAAQEAGYGVALYVTYNNPEREKQILRDVQSARCACIVTVTSLAHAAERYRHLTEGGVRVAFAERADQAAQDYVGFDMADAAQKIAARVLTDGAQSVGLMTDMLDYPNERLFAETLQKEISQQRPDCTVQCIHTVSSQYVKRAYQFLDGDLPEAIVATNGEMAKAIVSALSSCVPGKLPRVYAPAPQRVIRERVFERYGLNYRLLGQTLARMLMDKAAAPERCLLSADGFAQVEGCPQVSKHVTLRMLTINSPHTAALRQLSRNLSRTCGIDLEIVTLPYSELNQAVSLYGGAPAFDLYRIDMAQLGQMAKALYVPLKELPLDLTEIRSRMLESLWGEFTSLGNVDYALPADPSAMVLFYRKDLMEDTALQRAYYEHNHQTLQVPTTYEQLVEESGFFMDGKSGNASICYGTAMNNRDTEYVAHLAALNVPLRELNDKQLSNMLTCHRQLLNTACVPRDGWWWRSLVDRYCEGQSMFTMVYANYAEEMCGSPLSRVSGRIGDAIVPGGRPLLGGGVIGVSMGSAHPKEAAEVLEWMYSPEISCLIALLSGTSPCAAAYQNEQILNTYPWLASVRASFDSGVRRKLFLGMDAAGTLRETEEQIGFHARNAMTGVVTCDQAANNMLCLMRESKHSR